MQNRATHCLMSKWGFTQQGFNTRCVTGEMMTERRLYGSTSSREDGKKLPKCQGGTEVLSLEKVPATDFREATLGCHASPLTHTPTLSLSLFLLPRSVSSTLSLFLSLTCTHTLSLSLSLSLSRRRGYSVALPGIPEPRNALLSFARRKPDTRSCSHSSRLAPKLHTRTRDYCCYCCCCCYGSVRFPPRLSGCLLHWYTRVRASERASQPLSISFLLTLVPSASDGRLK